MEPDAIRQEITEIRQNIAALKRRYERNVKLHAATCVEKRAIQGEQQKLQRLKRQCPAVSSSWEDSFAVS
ncbi:MAG: hypothetical protein WAR83_09315 [Flavobacteriales bacterium]|jgi:hypothetical protein|nr:hypothetical protein [Flavobacteriales bacterium]